MLALLANLLPPKNLVKIALYIQAYSKPIYENLNRPVLSNLN